MFFGSNEFEKAVQKINISIDVFNTSLRDLEFVTVIGTGTEVQLISTLVRDVAFTTHEMSRKMDEIGKYHSDGLIMEANVKTIKYKIN